MRAEFLALCVLAAADASAQEQRFTIGDTKVDVTVDSPWPDALNKGWQPIYVRIENGDERAHEVRLRGNSWGVSREITANVRVEAGQSTSVELLSPVFAGQPNSVSLRVELQGRTQFTGSDHGASESVGPSTHAVLVFASRLPTAGTAERWTELLSSEVVGGEYLTPDFGPVRTLQWSRSGGSSTTPDNMRVATARFDRMPARSEAYSSLDAVVLDTSDGLPDARRLAPLIAWAKLGGALVVVGKRADAAAREIPELAAWMEPRFLRSESASVDPDGELTHPGWRLGLGALFVDGAPAMESELQRDLLRMIASSSRGIVDDPAGSRMRDSPPMIPDLFALPLKTFALFLIAFAVVIGPVNFILVRRGKRPALLLLTIPAIAFGAALVLLVVGILAQGLGVEIASRTFTVLDQREHRASSAEVRMIFAGLSPGSGLRPKSGSSCYAVTTYDSTGGVAPIDDNRTFRIDQTDGILLTGQFIPSRTAFLQQVLSEHAERARLAIGRDNGVISVGNGLGAGIRSLVLRDAAGGYYRLSGPLAQDSSAHLIPVDAEHGADAARDLQLELLAPALDELPPASYVAALDRNPFGDDCGVTGEEVESRHHLFGVLSLDAEEWR